MHHPHENARPRRGAGRAARTAAGLALIPALALAGAAPAAAHDELVRTSPGVDETVGTAPERVALTFSGDLIDGEGIQNLLQVRDAAGNQWQAEPGTVDGPGFSAPLCEGLPNGDYRVAYRVVYSDGHSEERAFGFAVDD
ncbi:copper resistance protein CopC, partial [Micrococcus sp. HG099]